jgi:hypothetical protein
VLIVEVAVNTAPLVQTSAACGGAGSSRGTPRPPAFYELAGQNLDKAEFSAERSWHIRGQNFCIAYTWASEGATLTQEGLRIGGDRVHVLPKDESGPLDVEAIAATADDGTAVYCCGPQRLLRAVEDACQRLAPAASLYTERFTPGDPVPGEVQAAGAGDDRPFQVELRKSGRTLQVPVGRTLLEVVRDAVPDVPYSCEEGC